MGQPTQGEAAGETEKGKEGRGIKRKEDVKKGGREENQSGGDTDKEGGQCERLGIREREAMIKG